MAKLLFAHALVSCLLPCGDGNVIRREPPASKEGSRYGLQAEADEFEFAEFRDEVQGPWQLACGYQPMPRKDEALQFSGSLLTLFFNWIPKPCVAPLLLRWYGSYFPHIITAAVSPPPETSPVPHVRCRSRGTSHVHLCYAKVLRRHKGFANYLFLDSEVLMRPHHLLGFPLDQPWVLSCGGHQPRSFNSSRLLTGPAGVQEAGKSSKGFRRQWQDEDNLIQWWQHSATPKMKKIYSDSAGGPWFPQPAVLGVANIPAAMSKYYVALADSMADVHSKLAHAMILDLWEMVPGVAQRAYVIGDQEAFWAQSMAAPEALYEAHPVAFVHPIHLWGVRHQQMLDQYLQEHMDEF